MIDISSAIGSFLEMNRDAILARSMRDVGYNDGLLFKRHDVWSSSV